MTAVTRTATWHAGEDDLSDAIARFTNVYATVVVDQLRAVPDATLRSLAEAIAATVARDRSTIYVFGNGGSHAISRHLEHELRSSFTDSCGVRVNCGIDYHSGQHGAVSAGFDAVFETVLRAERATPADLVIFISGSGDSDNLLSAAGHCRRLGIPTISLAGFDGGRITARRLTDLPVVIPVHDQQMSEDVIQALLRVAVECARRCHAGVATGLAGHRDEYATSLAASFERLQAHAPALDRLSRDVCRAFIGERSVFLLAPEGGPLSISAEHTAHNFNWDAVFEVRRPPSRRIHSTPTTCDYSGIGNDRLVPGIVSCQQLAAACPGDLLLLYAREPGAPAIRNTAMAAGAAGMTVYQLAGDRGGSPVPERDTICLGSADPGLLGDVGQATGHVLGRVIRLRLKQRLDGDAMAISEPVGYLVEGDLAQRRLIDVIRTL
ncbi:MAG: SIS domain-containing protein [Chloroflexi bacterium]|nr:MAG: SIS domain-containing protein [Chloroflexota bacterium]